jgi:dihydrofolate reductase
MKLIVATDEANGIGLNGSIPWKNSVDMQWFKFMTSGAWVVMGRKTRDSLGKSLPNRVNFILSSRGLSYDGFIRLYNQEVVKPEVFIIGGSEIYNLFLKENMVTTIFQTHILGTYNCDRSFYIPKDFDKSVELEIEDFRVTKHWRNL